MPPERLRFDRKDLFKERKHHHNNNNNNSHHQNDRSSDSLLGGSGGYGGGSLTRWRDYHSPSHHSHSREFACWGSPDFRRPPGLDKQGGWHLFAEESGNVYAPSRSSDEMPEDDNSRISVSRGDRKYGRNSKENRSSFDQRDGRGHAWNTSNRYATTSGRLHNVNCDQRSFDMLTYPFHPQSESVNALDHLQLKDQHDNKIGGVNGLGTDQRCERENSLDWKINWTRSGGFSSRGAGLSHLSSWKSIGCVDYSEGKTNLRPKNATPVRSPSEDVATYVTSGALSEETSSKKKPRLGWGEGLAKYEKKKVEVPDVSVSKDIVFNSSCNAEPVQSLSSNLDKNSLKVVGFSDCASPATPPSVSCSSSPGVEEKAFGKAVSAENDGSNLHGSPSIGSRNHFEGFLLNFEKLDNDSIGDVLKTLETAESEIDSLENELKLLKSELGNTSRCPASSTSLSVEDCANQFNEQCIVSNSMAQPAPLQIDCGGVTAEEMPDCSCGLEELHADGKDEDINIPGAATSKSVEPSSFVKPLSPPDMIKNGESFRILDAIHTTNTEVKCVVPASLGERTAGVHTRGDGGILIDSKNNAPVPSDCCAYPNGEHTLCDIILGSNKKLANEASEVFNKLLLRGHSKIDILGVANVFCGENDSLIKENFAKRKHFIRFKERVLTCKFKAFQHLWKEDLRLLSIRKYCVMSQKKCELSSQTTFSGYEKHCPSIRPRFFSPAGNLILVPDMGVINFTSKLPLDFQIKVCRDSLKMPALILDEKEKIVSRFISSNGLVGDPCAVEKEKAMINPWNAEEREMFLDMLATFGKDFRKVASFLDYKTTADCVEFYYKNHKSDCFQKIKKQDFSKQGKTSADKYLVTSGKRNRRMNAASLDILGEASEIAASAQSDSCRLINSARISSGRRHDSRTSLGNVGIVERSSRLDVLGSENENAAADVLVGICGSLSSEAINSRLTSALDPGEGQWDWKHPKVDSVMRLPSTSDVIQNVDDDTCSDESCGEMDHSDWTDEEKSIFLQAVSSYGKDFYMIAGCVRTRSRDQCKAFFSKARKCLGLDLIHTRQGNVRTSVNGDANGGGSDSKDACVLDTSTVICCDKLGSNLDEDFPAHVMNNQDESLPSGTTNLQTDVTKCEDDSGMALLDGKDSETVKPLIYDASKSESRSFELESNRMNGMDNQSESVLDQKNAIVLFKTAVRDKVAEQVTGSVSAGEAIDTCPSSCNAVEERNDMVAEASTRGFESGLHELMLPYEQDKNCNVDASGENEILQDSNTTGSAFNYVDTSLCSVSSMLDSVDKPPVVSLLQENSLAAATSIPHDSLAIQCEKTFNQDRLSSTLDLVGQGSGCLQLSCLFVQIGTAVFPSSSFQDQ